jgi:hypothetical protein
MAWSTKMVLPTILCLVSIPVICPMNPGVDDSSWSTDTTSPGDRLLLLSPKFFLCLSGLVLQGVLVADAL